MTISKPRSLNPKPASPRHKRLWKTTRSKKTYRTRESFRRKPKFKPPPPRSHRVTPQSRLHRLTLRMHKPVLTQPKQKYRTLKHGSQPHKPTPNEHNSKESGRKRCLSVRYFCFGCVNTGL